MQNFIFQNPTKILFGKGQTSQIGVETLVYGKKIMLLFGRGSIKSNGVFKAVIESFSDAGIAWLEYGGVQSNPTLSFVKKAILDFKEENLDVIVAVGGGSVIDTAKAIAAGVYYDGDVWDLFEGKAKVERAVPITTVLTLAATGSEMNSGGVITNEETRQKFNLNSNHLFPKVSVLDPVNTFSVPRNYSMYGAVDAISHVLEGYFYNGDKNTVLQDRFVEAIIKTIMESAEIILDNPKDYEARASLMWSATLALNGLTMAGSGCLGFPMHMIEHSLSALYDIPHGAGLSIVIPAWMKYYSQKNLQKFSQFASRIFNINNGNEKQNAQSAVDLLELWFKKIKVPVRLKEATISSNEIENIANNATMLAKRWHLTEYNKELIEEILHKAEE